MARWFGYLESILGLIAAFTLGVAMPFATFLWGMGLIITGWWIRGGLLILAAPICGFCTKIVTRLAVLWEYNVFRPSFREPPRQEPEQLSFDFEEEDNERIRRTLIGFMASSLPPLSGTMRVLCALNWATQFATATYIGHWICRGAAHAVNNDHALFALACAGHFAFLVAANLFLVLAAAVLTPETNGWHFFYRSRFLLDIATVSISIAAVLFL